MLSRIAKSAFTKPNTIRYDRTSKGKQVTSEHGLPEGSDADSEPRATNADRLPIASTEGPLATLSKSRRARSESFGIMRADVERHRARNSTPWNNRYVKVHHILTDAKFLVKANSGVVAVICLNVYHPYSATRGDISKLLD